MLFLIILNLYKVIKQIHCASTNPNPNSLNTVVIDTNICKNIRREREEILYDTSDEDNNDENNSVINLVDTNEEEKSATESEQDKETNDLNKEIIENENNGHIPSKNTKIDVNIDFSDNVYEQNFNKFCEENDESENEAQNMQYLSVIPEDHEEANEGLRKKLSKSNSLNGTGTKPKNIKEKTQYNNLSKEENVNKVFNSLFTKELKKPEISSKIHFLNLEPTMFLNADDEHKNNNFSEGEVTNFK